MSRRKKEKDEAKDGEQYARFVEVAERIGPYNERVLDEALTKISKTKPEPKNRDKKGNGEAPPV